LEGAIHTLFISVLSSNGASQAPYPDSLSLDRSFTITQARQNKQKETSTDMDLEPVAYLPDPQNGNFRASSASEVPLNTVKDTFRIYFLIGKNFGRHFALEGKADDGHF
jgi:hypothetical protein